MRYCAPTATFDVLQQAQNNLATVVCQRGRTHAKPLLGSLYWLLIRQQVTYKMVSPTITVLSASTSAYLSDLLQTAVSVRPLRLSDVPLPSVPRTQTEFAWQVFSAASSYTRNLLPYDATTTTTAVSRPFVLDYPGEPAPEETFTHSPILIIIQTISFFHLLRSTASYLLNLRAWQSFCKPLSMSSLVYLLVWSSTPHTPYISLPSQCLLFAIHAHTIAARFAVVSRLYHLFLISVSTLYLVHYLLP